MKDNSMLDFIVFEEEFGGFVNDFTTREKATAYCEKRNTALAKKGFCPKYNLCTQEAWLDKTTNKQSTAGLGELKLH